VKLIITGKPSRSVVEQARLYGVENYIHLTGLLKDEDLPWYLGCADLFVLPLANKLYNIGRWPNKICDYMSLGRPIVSNAVGDIKQLFEEYQIGLLSGWSPLEFASQIGYLIGHPEMAAKLGINARNTAVHVYDWKILIRRLEQFYFKMVSQDRAEHANRTKTSSNDHGSRKED
jgi:glycosyltransferase involved in cell wall biosynthesis